MQTQLSEQRAEFRLEQRPILSVDAQHMSSRTIIFDAKSNKLTWQYPIKNYGKGTAFDIGLFDYISVMGGHFRGENSNSRVEVVPNQTLLVYVTYSDSITPDTYAVAKSIDDGIIVKAILKYKDASGFVYTSMICFSHAADEGIGNCDLLVVNKAVATENQSAEEQYR